MADHGPGLPSNVRKVVTKVTNKLFVDQHSYLSHHRTKDVRKGNEYLTSLPLQIALYFNAFYFPVWVISSCITYQAKYSCLDELYRVVVIALVVMMSFVELIRLYLGYLGNLTEKVPELAGSWLLTILLQLPSCLFLLLNYRATRSLPLEIAMNVVLVTFVFCEIIIGAVALNSMVNYQASQFHIQQFVKAEDVPEEKASEHYPGEINRRKQQ
ncbi:transmembrane protein 17B-like [Watersipora subatra]|uniref:transmembrane protein 17B-like n=1 Tax=Watersipora subatra TaxID=2589382 RepID=UPI00355C5394